MKKCPHCGKKVRKELDEQLKKEYPYVCFWCDENLYVFEVK